MQSSSLMPLHGASTDVRLAFEAGLLCRHSCSSNLHCADCARLRCASQRSIKPRRVSVQHSLLNEQLRCSIVNWQPLPVLPTRWQRCFPRAMWTSPAYGISDRNLVHRLPLVAGVVFGFDHKIEGIPRAGYTFLHNGELLHDDIASTYDIEADSPWYKPSTEARARFLDSAILWGSVWWRHCVVFDSVQDGRGYRWICCS